MWPKEPLPLPCPGTWKGAPVVWEGAGRTPLASPFLPLPGPVWPEAEPASSCSSPRRPVSPPWRGGTSRPVPSPTLPRPPAVGIPGPEAPGPSWAPTQARNKAQCVIPVQQPCHLPGPALHLLRPSAALPRPFTRPFVWFHLWLQGPFL